MNEVILTEAEEIVVRGNAYQEIPSITISKDHIYFNAAFCKLFRGTRVTISKSGPYIVFREASGTTNSYTVVRRLDDDAAGARIGSRYLMHILNPGRQKKKYPVHPVKGGGWCIKVG